MIKLEKLECPNVLRQNKDRWTAELMAQETEGKIPKKATDQAARRYRVVKPDLEKETHAKCAYCECYPRPGYPGDIEHIKPKSKYPHLTFEWKNLTYVCWQCNNNKRDKYDKNCLPINPYDDDPRDFFDALRAYIRPKDGNERAQLTDNYLDLNREDLLTDRRKRLKRLKGMFGGYIAATDEDERKALLSQIKIEIAEDKEYSFCLKAAFEQAIAHRPS
jgi:uncharacterized protein (TIGR02646 family)